MSYQQEIRDVLQSKLVEYNSGATFEVSVARAGSFEMKVLVREGSSLHEHIFDLSSGFTPRTRKAIQDWLDVILTSTTTDQHKPSII